MEMESYKTQINDIVWAANEIFCSGYQPLSPGTPDQPIEFHIELTYRCNLRCMMCDLWDAHRRLPKDRNKPEIKIFDIEHIFSESALFGNINTVVLSGGEPFLAEDFTEIVNFFKNEFPASYIWILSNLYDTELTIEKLGSVTSPEDVNLGIGTSLDGLEQSHDRIRGQKGCFVRLMETVARVRKNFPKVKLFTSFTITPYNFSQLLDTYNLSLDLGIPFSAQFSVERLAGRGYFTWLPAQLDSIEKQIAVILDKLIADKGLDNVLRQIQSRTISSDLFTQIIYWGNLVKYQREKKRLFRNCPAGSRFIMLSPNKELYFCPILKYQEIGNVDSGSIDAIWASEKAQKLRSEISEKKCHCWLNCVVYPLAADCISRARDNTCNVN